MTQNGVKGKMRKHKHEHRHNRHKPTEHKPTEHKAAEKHRPQLSHEALFKVADELLDWLDAKRLASEDAAAVMGMALTTVFRTQKDASRKEAVKTFCDTLQNTTDRE